MLRIVKYLIPVVLAGIFAAYVCFAGALDRRNRSSVVCNGIGIIITDSATCSFISPTDIRKFLDKEYGPVIGVPLSDINNSAIEKVMLSNHAIRSCQSYTDISGMLNLRVTQRQPVLRLMGKDGWYYSDDEGFVFPLQGSYISHVPVVTGDIPLGLDNGHSGPLADDSQKEWIAGMLRLSAYINDNSYWSGLIGQINVRPDGDISLIPLTGSKEIIYGGFDDMEDKFYRIRRFYDTVLPGNEESYSEFSVKYKDQIVCTRTKNKKKQ